MDALLRAVQAGDRAAFDSLVSRRDPSFADRVRLLWTNLTALPLAELEIRLQPDVQDLTGRRSELLGPNAWRQPAVLTWRLAEEQAAAEHTVWLTFERLDGEPLLAGTADRPEGPEVAEPVWWTGPVTAAQDGPVTVLVGAGQPVAGWRDRVVAAVAQARERAAGVATAGWAGAVVVEVPATRRAFETVLGAVPGSYAGIAAVTRAEGPATTAAVRVVVNPEVVRTLTPAGVAVVLVHEVVHVATGSTDSPAPTWLLEGYADLVALAAEPTATAAAAEPLLRRVREDGPPAALPDDERFRTGAADVAAAYAEAWLACQHVAEEHGEAALQALYAAVDGGVGLDQAVQDALGTTVAGLTAGWQRYLVRLAES